MALLNLTHHDIRRLFEVKDAGRYKFQLIFLILFAFNIQYQFFKFKLRLFPNVFFLHFYYVLICSTWTYSSISQIRHNSNQTKIMWFPLFWSGAVLTHFEPRGKLLRKNSLRKDIFIEKTKEIDPFQKQNLDNLVLWRGIEIRRKYESKVNFFINFS